MLDNILRWVGAGDAAITAMGPLMTIALAWLFGGGLTQFVKFPLNAWLGARAPGCYDWCVRAVAVAATAGFAHVLSEALPWPLELGAGVTQILAYHAFRAVVKRRWPWLEASLLVGSATPSDKAVEAKADRRTR